jgi:hypothetical protein
MAESFDVYFSADIEADGPIPGRYSMLSFGLAVAGSLSDEGFERAHPAPSTFYRELRPISDEYDRDTLEVSGLDRAALASAGAAPESAMTEAAEWVRGIAGEGQPVLVAYPLAYDWSFLYWYFVAFSRTGSPFGYSSAFDMKTAFSLRGARPLAQSGASWLPKSLQSTRSHHHHALEDALEQAEIFANIIEWSGTGDGG